MNIDFITKKLQSHKDIFKSLLLNLTLEEYLWKPDSEKWCQLEIVCHLYDEEREDFRIRIKQILENPELPLPPADPAAWVTERRYVEQNYEAKLENFLIERDNSIEWLQSLDAPKWDNTHIHPTAGPISAEFILTNWLAHDYLHIKQITRTKYDYLKYYSGHSLDYAGEWK